MIARSGERGSGISVLATRHDEDDKYLINSTFFEYHLLYNVNEILALLEFTLISLYNQCLQNFE